MRGVEDGRIQKEMYGRESWCMELMRTWGIRQGKLLV